MVDFASITFTPNIGSQGSPDWSENIAGTHPPFELRFYDSAVTALLTTSADSWPQVNLPTTVQGVDYAYAFTDDTTGFGVLGNGGDPEAFTLAHYLQYRLNWDGTGTFGAAPVFTAYPSTDLHTITRGDGSILGGNLTDTNSFSYYKATAYGSFSAPGSAPAAPNATDGSIGAVTPGSAAWSAWQSLMGDLDWIVANATPAATTAGVWYFMIHPFVGPHLFGNVYTPPFAARYVYA